MAKIANQVKLTWLKSMEALGTVASNLANSAKLKAKEIRLEARRREIMAQLGVIAFDLWQKGEKLPETLEKMLVELSELTEKLSALQSLKRQTVENAAELRNDAGSMDESCDDSEAIRESITHAEQEALEALEEQSAQEDGVLPDGGKHVDQADVERCKEESEGAPDQG